jgi:hypothetical protein
LLNASRRGLDSSITATSIRPICGSRLPFIALNAAFASASAFGGSAGKRSSR